MSKLSEELLKELLPSLVTPCVFESLPSTNTYLKEQALSGAPEYTLAVAASQTDGHGRFGRPFFSPPETGVYFSILLRPAPTEDTAALKTVAAALSSAESSEAVFSVQTEIKWVNDVLIDGRKVIGILAEAFSGSDFFVILGIGANIAPPPGDFPPELEKAGSLADRVPPGSRERFVTETVTRLLKYLENTDKPALLEAYRKRVNMTGKLVTVTRGSEQFLATVMGIDDDARLVVSRVGGGIENLTYGEVTLHNEN